MTKGNLTNRLFRDILYIAIIFVAWSNATNDDLAKGLVLLMFLGLFTLNIYNLLHVTAHSIIDKIVLCFSFFAFSSVALMIFIIDDLELLYGVIFIFIQLLLLSFMSLILLKSTVLNKYKEETKNIIMFVVSVVILLIEILVII